MTISLITDGMLGYVNLQEIRVSDDLEASYGPLPHVPCAPEGIVEPIPPSIPIGLEASGVGPPHVPCGPTGIDTTISPPAVPRSAEGSLVPGSGPPAKPNDPQGNVT
jgi:hypothetical protein